MAMNLKVFQSFWKYLHWYVCNPYFIFFYWLLDIGDPLTPEEQDEKEQLLEEVRELKDQCNLCFNWITFNDNYTLCNF